MQVDSNCRNYCTGTKCLAHHFSATRTVRTHACTDKTDRHTHTHTHTHADTHTHIHIRTHARTAPTHTHTHTHTLNTTTPHHTTQSRVCGVANLCSSFFKYCMRCVTDNASNRVESLSLVSQLCHFLQISRRQGMMVFLCGSEEMRSPSILGFHL